MRYKTLEDHTMPIMDYADVQKKKKNEWWVRTLSGADVVRCELQQQMQHNPQTEIFEGLMNVKMEIIDHSHLLFSWKIKNIYFLYCNNQWMYIDQQWRSSSLFKCNY